MIITTSYRVNPKIISTVNKLVKHYNLLYIPRKKYTLPNLFQRYNCPIIIVTSSRIIYKTESGQIYFHPNLSQIRSKRIENGESDNMIDISGLEKDMSFLDCTMGLGTDSLIASQVVGDSGQVVALESSPIIHMVIKEGMNFYPFETRTLQLAASRIKFQQINYLDYLKIADDNSFDVVYFDPMFDSSIKETTPIEVIQDFANHTSLDSETIAEAKRVAKKCVIMKNHYTSKLFNTLGFKQHIRKTSQFHYGVLDLEEQ